MRNRQAAGAQAEQNRRKDRAPRKAATPGSPRTGVTAHVHPETSTPKQQTHQPGELTRHAFTQPAKKTSVPDSVTRCRQVQKDRASPQALPESTLDESGEGSNPTTSAPTPPETSPARIEQTPDRGRNAPERNTLQEPATHTQQ